MELHHKLSDSQAGSKEFWAMLARIRKDGLARKEGAAKPPSPAKPTGRKRSSENK